MKNEMITWYIRYKIRSIVDVYPKIYLPLCRLRLQTQERTVTKDTEIVIEGFPRSANTFSVAAFTLAQENPVVIAHHLHAPAQVIAAVSRGIPIIVLIRHPRAAVLSLLVRTPHIQAEHALKDYIRFYSSLMALRGKFVLARFEEVTQDYGHVIKRVNECFGTQFRLFEHTKNNVERVFQVVEQMDKEDTKSSQVLIRTVARPSKAREALKASREKEFDSPQAENLLFKAENIYDRFIAYEGSSKTGSPH